MHPTAYPTDWIYDIETYPNIFTCALKHPVSGVRRLFEISDRRNDHDTFVDFIRYLAIHAQRMVGFNSVGFDYPVIHYIMQHHGVGITATQIYDKAMSIINAPFDQKFAHMIWDNDRYVEQLDLFLIHHFNNKARSTSLKILEFNMLVDNVENLPFPVGTILKPKQMDTLIEYNVYGDVDNTEKFYLESLGAIAFRMELSEKYNRNFLNHNDTKIGKDFFIMELEKALPGSCYEPKPGGGGRQPRQTIRHSIALKDAIFPYISFTTPEFQRIRDWLAAQTITETKGVFKDLSCTVNGFQYDFGVGGIHGSLPSTIVSSDDDHILIDLDVTSYYPRMGIVNKIYPEHLSESFCDIYNDVFNQRVAHPKKTHPNENLMLKYALNGVYGDSNNKYSPFYDSMYTMKITINGQLLLCMLAEHLATIPDLQMIQINTDGLTVKVPSIHTGMVDNVRRTWEKITGLQLEEARYSRMFIRDVNSYIGEYENGGLKRKGAYAHNRDDKGELPWHKNHSSLIIPKAAEAALIRGEDIETFIKNHPNIMDFMLRTKIRGKDVLVSTVGNIDLPGGGIDLPEQKVTRYYISTDGRPLFKISPPAKGHKVGTYKRKNGITDAYYNSVVDELGDGAAWDARINTKNMSKYEIRRTGVNAGCKVTTCNDISKASRDNINYDWYIAETMKLVKPLMG